MRVRKKKKNWVWSELNIHHQTEWATERKCPTSHLRQPCPIQRCICVFNEQGIGVLLSLFPTHSRFISSLTDSLSCFLFFPSFTCFPLPVCSSSKKKKKKATASYLCVYLKGGWEMGGSQGSLPSWKQVFWYAAVSISCPIHLFPRYFNCELFPDPLYIFLPYNIVGVLVPILCKV